MGKCKYCNGTGWCNETKCHDGGSMPCCCGSGKKLLDSNRKFTSNPDRCSFCGREINANLER